MPKNILATNRMMLPEPPPEGRGIDRAPAIGQDRPVPAVEDGIKGKLVLGVE